MTDPKNDKPKAVASEKAKPRGRRRSTKPGVQGPNKNERPPNKNNKNKNKKSLKPTNSTHTQVDSVEKFRLKFNDMEARNGRGDKLTQAYCDFILGLCVALNEWDDVLVVLDVMKQQGLSQERSTYRACLQACFEYSNGPSASEILDAMDKAMVKPDPIDVSLVVATMCKTHQKEGGGWWKRGLTTLKSHAQKVATPNDRIPVEAYDAVLSCISAEPTQWKNAVRLLYLMEKGHDAENGAYHPGPVLSTYRLVIETCVAANEPEQAFQVLTAMAKRGLKPTPYMFELVSACHGRRRQWRRALQLLDMMETMKVKKTVVTYNTVISACAKAGEVGTAKKLLGEMRREGVNPNIFSFNAVISACAGTSRWRDALAVLDQCHREPGVEPDIITYTNAVRACARGGRTRRALSLMQVVKDKQLPLDDFFYTAMIDACAKGKLWRRALELLEEMEQNQVTPTAITYSVAISACGNGGQWEKALELLDQMKDRNMTINLITYNSAITALSKASRRNARSAAKESVPQTFTKDGANEQGDSGVLDDKQLWKKALALLDEIKANGLEPDGFTFSAAITCCGAGRRWEEALELINSMKTGGPKAQPNKIAFTAAIAACGRSGKHEEALKLFSDMKEQGLQPDRVAYNTVFTALRVARADKEAFKLWEEMCGKHTTSKTPLVVSGRRPSLEPDIITLTDVIATLTRSNGDRNREKIDSVFADAVQRKLVLQDHLDRFSEIDLSGLSLPVARAACRYVMSRIREKIMQGAGVDGVTFITGVGRGQQRKSGQVKSVHESEPGAGLSLREHIQDVLRSDFNPSIESVVPALAKGTVEIEKQVVDNWVRQTLKSS